MGEKTKMQYGSQAGNTGGPHIWWAGSLPFGTIKQSQVLDSHASAILATLQMVILVPAATCTTPAESATVASAFLQHRPNRPVLHLYFYNTGRIGQCRICIFTTPAGSASVAKTFVKHMQNRPMLEKHHF